MNSRVVSIMIIAIFLGSAGFVSAGNAHMFSLLPGLQQDTSANVGHSSGSSYYYSHFNIRTNLSLQSNNPLSTWSPTSSSSYVISVPSGSTFSQYVQPIVTLQGETDLNTGHGGEMYQSWNLPVQVYVNVTFQSYSSAGIAGSSVILSTHMQSVSLKTSGQGYGQVQSYSFPSVNINVNESNTFGSMMGILKASVSFSVNYPVSNGDIFASLESSSNTYHVQNAISAEEYVFPGTGTLNTPNPQAVVVGNGNYTTITGTMNYGTYSLLISGPHGYSKTVNLGSSTKLDNRYSYKFTPTQVGNYTVTLRNSVVQLDYQNFFGVTATMPQPTVVIDSQSSSGYFLQGQQINYTVRMQYNTTDKISFIINIWDGQSNQHSVSQAYQIELNQLEGAKENSAGVWTYSGSFVVNSEGVSAGYITISASGYYFNPSTGQYLRSVSPGIATIQVTAHHKAPAAPPSIIPDLEAMGALIAAGIAAYLDPDTMGIKAAIFGSGMLLALVFLGVIP